MSPVDWITQLSHSPLLLILAVAVTAFAESLALVGLLVPGVIMLTAAASLAGHDQVSITALLISGFIGAVLGDGISYWLGHRYRERIVQWWPFTRHPELIERGRAFFERYGSLSIIFGRFVGPVRPVIPLVAGMMAMPWRRFMLVNALSAAAWSPAYLLPGYFLGRSWQEHFDLPMHSEHWLSVLLLIVIVAGLLFSWLRRRLDRDSRFYRLLLRQARRHQPLRWLWLRLRHDHLHGEVPLASVAMLLTTAIGFVTWTLLATGLQQPLLMDVQVQSIFQLVQHPWLTRLAVICARIGDAYGTLALLLPWLLWLLAGRYRAALFHWLVGLGLLSIGNTLLKQLIGRTRPDAPEYLAHSFSYPSAHASTAVLVAGLASAFWAESLSLKRRHWPYLLAVLWVTVIGMSRLVFGVHWSSDIIGGILFGLTLCAGLRISYHASTHKVVTGAPWLMLGMASLVLVGARILWLPPF
ncbi:undecaprenyl-diphosphatase [Kushneria sinocarnis]|uniref:Undecaprenyl-diphosphatase n=1 Tax=Kushneria sinocarnis TaxID=595502 RepID=A0A420WYU3_9GAMM|nr:bifunctional DedA family/phosphatase PAP2 family protein [Kushneria sinocarnis]RKR06414.1 undecaprenyl-diphosphatase [Kushneria sinocarnis]